MRMLSFYVIRELFIRNKDKFDLYICVYLLKEIKFFKRLWVYFVSMLCG